jgi:hypothetical protein
MRAGDPQALLKSFQAVVKDGVLSPK